MIDEIESFAQVAEDGDSVTVYAVMRYFIEEGKCGVDC